MRFITEAAHEQRNDPKARNTSEMSGLLQRKPDGGTSVSVAELSAMALSAAVSCQAAGGVLSGEKIGYVFTLPAVVK